jgi:hypothetical protein
MHVIAYIYTDNLALNKPAWQSSQHNPNDDKFAASNAVDGRKSDLSGGGGQCAMSATNHRTAMWRVDLEGNRSIHHIVIYYRTDHVDFGLLSYSKKYMYSLVLHQ